MQLEGALRVRQAWGDKPCDHPDAQKEYDRGVQTGDWRCTQCGRLVDEPDRPKNDP
jgi:hypothetical protein